MGVWVGLFNVGRTAKGKKYTSQAVNFLIGRKRKKRMKFMGGRGKNPVVALPHDCTIRQYYSSPDDQIEPFCGSDRKKLSVGLSDEDNKSPPSPLFTPLFTPLHTPLHPPLPTKMRPQPQSRGGEGHKLSKSGQTLLVMPIHNSFYFIYLFIFFFSL